MIRDYPRMMANDSDQLSLENGRKPLVLQASAYVGEQFIGAQKRTRTSTSLRIHAPEACASTNSAIWAPERREHVFATVR